MSESYVIIKAPERFRHVEYFATATPQVRFSPLPSQAKVLDLVSCKAWIRYLAHHDVIPVRQVSVAPNTFVSGASDVLAVKSKLKRNVTSIMKNACSFWRSIMAVGIAMFLTFGVVVPQADAIVSSTATVNLSYVVGESISVSGAPPNLTFSGAPNPVTGPLTVTTSWVLAANRTVVDTNLFFATPSAAMTDGNGHNIPAASIQANVGGGPFSDCGRNPATDTNGVATAGGTCNVGFGVAITTANLTNTAGTTSTFVLQIPGAVAAALPAGTFTGQLNIVAGAI